MNSIENPSFAALIVGKIARASECNVKFILSEGTSFKNEHITLPSEALVTITGNLIDNALDAMNMDTSKTEKEISIGIYTRPEELLIIVKDTGPGIPDEIKEKMWPLDVGELFGIGKQTVPKLNKINKIE